MNLDDAAVLDRYKRFMADATPEHDRVLKEAAQYYRAYGLDSIGGRDFAELEKVWGDHPPEIGMVLSNVNTFWGSLVSSRKEPVFPGFDPGAQDAVLGEAMTQIVKGGRRWAKSDRTENMVLTDLILVGYGFSETYLDVDVRPPFRPDNPHIPLSDVWWDVGGHQENLADGQEFARRHRYSLDEAESRFHEHADVIQSLRTALGGGSASGGAAAVEGAKSLGGQNVSVKVTSTSSAPSGSVSTRRLREVAVDDFQFLCHETLAAFEMPDPDTGRTRRMEVRLSDLQKMLQDQEREAAEQGLPYERPKFDTYGAATWYRAEILAPSAAGEARVLKSATAIPGNQRLINAVTGYPEMYLDGDCSRWRFFGFGRVLYGLQRLTSVAIRVFIEQEARRNRAGGVTEKRAFDSEAERQAFISAQAVPGAWPTVNDGAMDAIHPNEPQTGSHVPAMQQMFRFFSVDLSAHMLGISDMSRGTFTEDRSAKFVSVMMETAIQMQSRFTTNYTEYLSEGAVTMARLLLEILDAKDIDRLIGQQPIREGITGQKNPETGQVEPIVDEMTGEPLTLGAFLKANAGEIFANDIGFGLRPSAASERMANAMLSMQHGWLEQVAKLLPPETYPKLAQAALKSSFAGGTDYADFAEFLSGFIEEQKQRQAQQAEVQQEQGWLQFISQLAQSDFEKAAGLMQQASQAVTGPQEGPPS